MATLDEAIEIVSQALGRGEVGFAGLISPHQMDRAAAWSRVCDLHAAWENEPGGFDNRYVRELRALIHECADMRAGAPIVHAINTTFYGKDAHQNHAPEAISHE